MPDQFNANEIIVRLNGHTFVGFADEDDAIDLPEIELAEIVRGMDGTMYSTSTGNKGGEVMLKFLPSSPSVVFMQNQAVAIQRGAVVNWNGEIRNIRQNYAVRLEGGVLTKYPAGHTMGKANVESMIYTWEFELIKPDYSAALFDQPPA